MALKASNFETFNLRSAAILVLEASTLDLDILAQVLAGFGANKIYRCESIEEAQGAVAREVFDLMVVASHLDGEDGCDFVRWVRRTGPEANRCAPVIMVAPHTAQRQVMQVRDCGAHYLVAKPLAPGVLLSRIFWVAQETRQFVISDGYVGPDRRWQYLGPPAGQRGRRREDLSSEVGAATQPNMSQDAIDALMAPTRVSL